jgi:hypothetical protein
VSNKAISPGQGKCGGERQEDRSRRGWAWRRQIRDPGRQGSLGNERSRDPGRRRGRRKRTARRSYPARGPRKRTLARSRPATGRRKRAAGRSCPARGPRKRALPQSRPATKRRKRAAGESCPAREAAVTSSGAILPSNSKRGSERYGYPPRLGLSPSRAASAPTSPASRLPLQRARANSSERTVPVAVFLRAISRGGPSATRRPPPAPPSGPSSIT